MSQENSVTTRRPRPLLDRVLVRVPWLAHFFIAWSVRLRPGSALRTRLTDWSFRRGFDAVNRKDPEAVGPLAYEPDAEVWVSGLELVVKKDCYRGHREYRDLFLEVDDAWSDWWWAVGKVLVADERTVVAQLDLTGRGRVSGAEVSVNGAGSVYHLSPRGRIRRQDFLIEEGGWQNALEVVGLSE
jgi:SnoaL-like domain